MPGSADQILGKTGLIAMEIILYDTTLRDGAQTEGISFSTEDKLRIARRLDEYGIGYIEGGFPGSNPKDREFFERAADMDWQQARICAFGATRYKDRGVEEDPTVTALLSCPTPAVTIVAKCSRYQVEDVLETTTDENLAMINETVAYLKEAGREVLVDAEHFYDGFRHDMGYTRACLEAAAEAGARWLVLCDTNGGSLPEQVAEATRTASRWINVPIGVHMHNDADLAAANTIAGVANGASQIQGTINGFGERCGNANLTTLIPTLQLKLGRDCVSSDQLQKTTDVLRFVGELANVVPDPYMPYVGQSAFAHKAGYHGSGVRKDADAYQHIDPSIVGNESRIVISELAGRSSIAERAQQLGLVTNQDLITAALAEVKSLEERGFQFEGAEASFHLLLHRLQDDYEAPFEFVDFLVLAETREGRDMLSEAMVKIRVGDEIFQTASDGNGPVSALDRAARKALERFFPSLEQAHLIDYKVRILDSTSATNASVRVLIQSSDGASEWGTVGSSTDIIEASWLALKDSYEYALLITQSSASDLRAIEL